MEEESEAQAAPDRPNTRRWLLSPATWSSIVSILLVLSTFRGEQTTQTVLVKLTAAAVQTCAVHTYLLLFSPPEEQMLSSFILAIITGPLAVYIGLLMLW